MGLRSRLGACVLAISCGRLGFHGESTDGGASPDATASQCIVPTDCPSTLTCGSNHTCIPIPPSTVGLVAYWAFDTASQWPDGAGGNNAACVAGQCPATIPA